MIGLSLDYSKYFTRLSDTIFDVIRPSDSMLFVQTNEQKYFNYVHLELSMTKINTKDRKLGGRK